MESPLNSWFRQQGASNRIPSLSSYNNLRRSTSNIQSFNQKNLNNSSTSLNKKIPNLINANFNAKNDFNQTRSFTYIKHSEPPKTPIPANLFYQRCINDVLLSNQPKELRLIEPRELKYEKSKPFLTYITYGCGKSKNYVWRIEKL
jgi:hypothetical protein